MGGIQTKEQRHASYLRNRDKAIARAKAYKAKNPDRVRANVRKWHARRMRESESYRIHRMWLSAKSRARKYQVPFEITPADICIPDLCPVFGFKLEYCFKKGAQRNSPSLDRIDPARGYVRGNIQVMSYLANAMKQNASRQELIQFAAWISKVLQEN